MVFRAISQSGRGSGGGEYDSFRICSKAFKRSISDCFISYLSPGKQVLLEFMAIDFKVTVPE